MIRGWLSIVLLIDAGAQKHRLGIQLYDRHHWTKRATVRRNWSRWASSGTFYKHFAIRSTQNRSCGFACIPLSQIDSEHTRRSTVPSLVPVASLPRQHQLAEPYRCLSRDESATHLAIAVFSFPKYDLGRHYKRPSNWFLPIYM